MADISKNLKTIWMKGIEAIGNTASNIASNTKQKVDEMNLVNRRREILSSFGEKSYALWQKGCVFPDELQADLQEVGSLDEQLNDLRAARYAVVYEPKPEKEAGMLAEELSQSTGDESAELYTAGTDAEQPQNTDEGTKPATEEAGDAEPEIPVISLENPATQEAANSLSSTINNLFDSAPSVDAMAEKVNTALDQMGEKLKQFSDGINQQLDDLSEQINRNPPSDSE